MTKIIVWYWKEHDPVPQWKHGAEFGFSVEKMREIAESTIKMGYAVMLKPVLTDGEKVMIIYINDGRFSQS